MKRFSKRVETVAVQPAKDLMQRMEFKALRSSSGLKEFHFRRRGSLALRELGTANFLQLRRTYLADRIYAMKNGDIRETLLPDLRRKERFCHSAEPFLVLAVTLRQ